MTLCRRLDRHAMEGPLKQLFVADPETARKVESALSRMPLPPSRETVMLLCEETIWGLSIEESFGASLAEAYPALIADAGPEYLATYRKLTRKAARIGPTVAKLYADSLVPVLLTGNDSFVEKFLAVLEEMLAKGPYTLPRPLEALCFLLDSGQPEAAEAFLALLAATFSKNLRYNQSKLLANLLPRAVRNFSVEKRVFQVGQLIRIVQTDVDLVEPFLDSLEKGLGLLDSPSLAHFVSTGLQKWQASRKTGERFLSLASGSGLDTLKELQVVAALTEVSGRLNRYLHARTGKPILVQPISCFGGGLAEPMATRVLSDGRHIYLPDEIHMFASLQENRQCYKLLAGLEAAYFERKTYDFDAEKAAAYPECRPFFANDVDRNRNPAEEKPELEVFFDLFQEPALAADLFTIFEHGRLRQWLQRTYPGFARRLSPLLVREMKMDIARRREDRNDLLQELYSRIALGQAATGRPSLSPEESRFIENTAAHFHCTVAAESPVEICAALTCRGYLEISRILTKESRAIKLHPPFGRSLQPGLFRRADSRQEALSRKMKNSLASQGVHVFRSDIVRALRRKNGHLSTEDLRSIMDRAKAFKRLLGQEDISLPVDPSKLRFDGMEEENGSLLPVHDDGLPLFRYPEWDCRLGDYLHDYVMVRERFIDGPDDDFFQRILSQKRGLVKRIRNSFELLKPQGLKILRKWLEGDDFDYRALIDFVLDKKAGIMPSDRLYVKRLKQERDVSVLVLVDLSRSTANPVAGSSHSVLDLEKEAIVLLCEALETVGDTYAIAGFSGTGRLGVDYFPIKRFQEPLNRMVRRKIGAIRPQRSTRMGAAVRHAASRLNKEPSRVRLLLILGDGFPNDTGYKKEYALEDTRRAILEARARNIFAHSITVNIAADKVLDNLYGKLHHNVISDVTDLPDRLFKIYGALTR